MINKNKNQGFTLVELMIAVAILGIISAIAMPSYTAYVQKAKRTEAKTELLRVAQLQESYYVQNLTYAKDMVDLGFSTVGQKTETELYNIVLWGLDSDGATDTCAGTNASPCVGYKVQALPVSGNGQDNDTSCAGFWLWNTGKKQARTSTSNWGDSTIASTCWN